MGEMKKKRFFISPIYFLAPATQASDKCNNPEGKKAKWNKIQAHF